MTVNDRLKEIYDTVQLSLSNRFLFEQTVNSGGKYLPRIDLYRVHHHIATITLPDSTILPIEDSWRDLAQVTSMFGATHFFFSHRAELSIVTTFGSEPVMTQCFCTYFTCPMWHSSFVYPYVVSEDNGQIVWQEEASSQFDPLEEMKPLENFLAIASQMGTSYVQPDMYLAWLTERGFVVEFHTPFTSDNFSATVS